MGNLSELNAAEESEPDYRYENFLIIAINIASKQTRPRHDRLQKENNSFIRLRYRVPRRAS